MCELYELFRAGARVFEHFENMPARAPAILDPQKPATRARARARGLRGRPRAEHFRTLREPVRARANPG